MVHVILAWFALSTYILHLHIVSFVYNRFLIDSGLRLFFFITTAHQDLFGSSSGFIQKRRHFLVQNNSLIVFSLSFQSFFHREKQVQLKVILNRLANIALTYFFNIKNYNCKRTKLLVFFQPIKARVEINNGLK